MAAEIVQSLPGFAEWASDTRKTRAGGADLSDEKHWTAERLKLCYPGVYDAIGRGLFYWQMPISALADICRVSRKTVAAIRDRSIAEATANATDPAALFCIKSRIRGQKDIIKARVVEELLERMSDPGKIAEMDTAELLTALTKLEDKQVAIVPQKQPSINAYDDISDYDNAINGLTGEKKSAARLDWESNGRDAALNGNDLDACGKDVDVNGRDLNAAEGCADVFDGASAEGAEGADLTL